MDLHFEVYGQGEPLIVLHGLFGSLGNWRSISTRLAQRFRVFALDQRNHGGSPHSLEMDYSSMAEDVCQIMDVHKLAEAAVLGHSMGGKTAMQLALLRPERVRKLVVVDMAPRAYPPWHEKILAGMLSLDLSLYKSRQEMETALAPAVPNISTRQFLLKNVERQLNGGLRWKIGLEEIKQNYHRLREAIISDHSFERPALFIHGEKSDFFLESDLGPIKRLFPRVLFQTIPGAGHLVHIENVEAFLASVINFLQDL